LMTLGSTLSVLVLFGSALALGQLMDHAARFTEVLSVLNGLIGILLLLWIANIVIISGAALDAEFLRARQIASGLHAWHTLQLEPHATHTIDFLADDSAQAERLGRAVAGSVREGTPLHRERGPWIVDSQHLLAVNPPRRRSRSAHPATSGDAPSLPSARSPPSASRHSTTAPAQSGPSARSPSSAPGPSNSAPARSGRSPRTSAPWSRTCSRPTTPPTAPGWPHPRSDRAGACSSTPARTRRGSSGAGW